MDPLHAALLFLVVLLAAGLLLGTAAERLRVPYTVALVLAAAPFGYSKLPVQFQPGLLAVFLPALIFEAAWNLDVRVTLRYKRAIGLLAVPGVLFSAAVVGLGLAAAGLLAPGPALLVGVVLGATDPVAVVAVLRRLAVPGDLATIVEAESLFNDGTAVVLYIVAVAVVAANAPADVELLRLALSVVPAFAGILVGLVIAVLVAFAARGSSDRMLEIVGTVVVAYGAYLVADVLAFSGIFATIAAGIGFRYVAGRRMDDERRREIDEFWSVVAFLANTWLFLLVGLRIEVGRIAAHPALVLTTLALVVLARVILAYGTLPFAGIGRGRRAWQHVVTLAGMRGALSLALALALPDDFPQRAQIVDAVFGVVLVTLVGQGLALSFALRRLRFEPETAET